jgi:predicted TIM-barrel fold metal-dependent hydrolase
MSYVTDRVVHDADSHIFENPEFFRPYASDELWERMPPLYTVDSSLGVAQFEQAEARQLDPDFRAGSADEVMSRKLWDAPGAWLAEDRVAALDAMGFASQLVFDSFLRGKLRLLERGDDMDLLYDVAWCHVRAMLDFGRGDRRLLPAGYVPLADPARTVQHMQRALEAGCRVVEVAADCPRDHSPAHADLEPFWRMAAEANVPVIYHLGGGRLPDPAFKVTGRREDIGFVGGDGTFNSLEYLGAPLPFMETLNSLVIDGVLERNPGLQLCVVEYAASWVPGYLRLLDTAHHAYHRLEERLQELTLLPSEYVRRQVKFAPFHFEDVGWLIDQSDSQMYLFSSDFPHKEGGRDPIARFEANFDRNGTPSEARERFYHGNFESMFGGRLTPA